jgi:hypothetical protein
MVGHIMDPHINEIIEIWESIASVEIIVTVINYNS